jgi:CRISPR/Cas system-associated exonuclease Cas4 (RecB family)
VVAPDPIIRASEIGQYAFCSRAWWLGRIKGYRSANLEAMEQGTALHRVHGRSVRQAHLLQRLALALLVLAAVALLAWVFLALVA